MSTGLVVQFVFTNKSHTWACIKGRRVGEYGCCVWAQWVFCWKICCDMQKKGGLCTYSCVQIWPCAHTKALRTGTPCSNHIQHLVLQRGNTLTDMHGYRAWMYFFYKPLERLVVAEGKIHVVLSWVMMPWVSVLWKYMLPPLLSRRWRQHVPLKCGTNIPDYMHDFRLPLWVAESCALLDYYTVSSGKLRNNQEEGRSLPDYMIYNPEG